MGFESTPQVLLLLCDICLFVFLSLNRANLPVLSFHSVGSCGPGFSEKYCIKFDFTNQAFTQLRTKLIAL